MRGVHISNSPLPFRSWRTRADPNTQHTPLHTSLSSEVTGRWKVRLHSVQHAERKSRGISEQLHRWMGSSESTCKWNFTTLIYSILQVFLAGSCYFSLTAVLGKRLHFHFHEDYTSSQNLSPSSEGGDGPQQALKASGIPNQETEYHVGHKLRSVARNTLFATFQTTTT